MAIEQVLKQEVKQLKSALKNSVKRSKISLAGNDDTKYQLSQINYFANKTKNTHIILPYGLAANPPEGEEALMFNIMGQEENTAAIPYATTVRFTDLQKKEVRIGNPFSSASVLFRNDGVASINGSEFEGLVKIVDLTTKLNNLVTDYNLHTHGGVQTGTGTSGVPTSATNSFSKSDYENTNVVHGKEGSGTSGGTSGTGNNDHSTLINLDYASAGHTGFEKSLTFGTGLIRAGDNITTNDSQINHDALLNFVAGEHFLQSAITQISAGVGNGLVKSTSGTLSKITDNSTNWNTAYSWGDHSVEGYLKNIVEDTTPQLGGNLDAQEYDIDNAGDIIHDDAVASDWEFYNSDQDKNIYFSINDGGTKKTVLAIGGSNGWVGVNTGANTPNAVFEVANDAANATIQARTYRNATGGSSWTSAKFRGTLSSPTAAQSGDTMGRFIFSGYDGLTDLYAGVRLVSVIDGTVSAGNVPGAFYIETTPVGGSLTERFRITNDGKMGINTLNSSWITAQLNLVASSGLNFDVYKFEDSDASANFNYKKARGDQTTPVNVQIGDYLMNFRALAYVNGTFYNTTSIRGTVTSIDAVNNRAGGDLFVFTRTSANEVLQRRMTWGEDGLITVHNQNGRDNSGTILFQEKDTTPANPTSATEVKMYMKDDKIIFQYNDAGTVRYKFLDLTGVGITWQHSTTAP